MWVKVKTTKIFLKPVTQQLGGSSNWRLLLAVFDWLTSIERHLVNLKTIIRQLNSPELGYNIVGIIVALACGGVQPLFAIMFSEILGKLLNL